MKDGSLKFDRDMITKGLRTVKKMYIKNFDRRRLWNRNRIKKDRERGEKR